MQTTSPCDDSLFTSRVRLLFNGTSYWKVICQYIANNYLKIHADLDSKIHVFYFL